MKAQLHFEKKSILSGERMRTLRDKKYNVLRNITRTLLEEVKSLNVLKTIEIEDGIDFDEEVKRFEIYLIERALDYTGGNQLRAAELLNIKHTTLNSKIKRYQISWGTRDLSELDVDSSNHR